MSIWRKGGTLSCYNTFPVTSHYLLMRLLAGISRCARLYKLVDVEKCTHTHIKDGPWVNQYCVCVCVCIAVFNVGVYVCASEKMALHTDALRCIGICAVCESHYSIMQRQ